MQKYRAFTPVSVVATGIEHRKSSIYIVGGRLMRNSITAALRGKNYVMNFSQLGKINDIIAG